MKLLLLLAFAANAILIVSSDEDTSAEKRASTTSVSSSSTYTSSISSSSSSTNSDSSDSTEDSSEEETCGTNERYVDCPDTLCEPETCNEVGYPQPCPLIGPDGKCPGEPGCVCIDGYVRNCKDICIPRTQCSSCGGDPNAVSGCGGNCGRLCSNYYKTNISCTLICNINGCDCKDDYVYDEKTEKCVLPEECTNNCTKDNEVFDPCPAPCPFRTCGIDDRAIFCAPGPKVGDPNCPAPVCRCKNGYYRNGEGECVTWEECPTCSKPNEVYDICPAPCPPRRCDVNEALILCIVPPKPGDPECEPGCRCADGYVKNAYEVCIPKDKCPKCTNPNEVYDACPSLCPPRRCDVDERAIRCAAPPKLGDPACEPGCRCADGFVRNSVGICVTRDQCNVSVCNKTNEVFDLCPPDCPPRRCDIDDRTISCPKPLKIGDPKCKPGCRCADGYVRNSQGNCVTRNQCPKCTRPNEVFHPCPPTCPPQTCDSLTRSIICPLLAGPYGRNGGNQLSRRCQPSCICKPGYYRNKIGECISRKDCFRCRGPHEYFSCGGACDNVCATLYKQNQTKCPIKNIVCNRKCYCEKGYARDNNNICIPIPQCPVSCAGDLNAIPGCGINCGRRCDDYFKKDVICPAVCYDDGCDCRHGYVFDANINRCVRPQDCTPVCRRNEVFSNCINGGCNAKYCSDLGKPVPCVRPKYCIKGCLCKKGYLRASDGTCVPEKKCPKPVICGKHEIYEECPPLLCQALNCTELGHPIACPDIAGPGCPWEPACICENGYLRNDKGVCIPATQCLSCAGDLNAIPGCGINCGRRCDDYFKKDVICPAVCYDDGCDCRHGYVFDANINRCVRPQDCTPVCRRNEVFSNCINGGCNAKYCSDLGKPVPCVRPKYCIKGCLCKKGYLRASDGTCVPEKKCPKPVICGKHEIYEECPPLLCQALNCTELGHPIACPDIAGPGCPWEPACICENGYLRNDKGVCIPATQCPTCGGDKNAVSGCGVNCGRLCSNYNKGPVSCIQVCYPNACDCKEDFVLDEVINKCVLPEECSPQCGPNEQYEECPSSSCLARNCSQLGFPLPCLGPTNCTEKSACVCKDGYLRNDDGDCVPQNECPSCGGDPNAKPGCGGHCGRRCSTYNKGPTVCPAICYLNSCDCKDDYVYDDNLGKCVRPEECTPSCGNDEVYSECINGGCQAKNCSQLGKPIPCVKIDPKYCIKGCLCKEGYLRLKNGTCVPKSECPQPECKKNEEYAVCPSGVCRPQSCDELGYPIPCPDAPQSGCTDDPACICKEGYVRSEKGVCISQDQCSSCGGDPNARPGCGVHCNQRCSDVNKEPGACILICYPNSCDCNEGYVFDDNTKTCVRPEKCTTQCGDDEEYSECINGGCQAKNCSQIGRPIPCRKIDPKYCIKGCLCKEGYLRLDNGTCVPSKDCPLQCTRPNEVYDPCPYECPPQTCESLDRAYICLVPVNGSRPCNASCRCIPGHYRNQIGDCISEEDCSKCKGPHEFFSCGGACDNECATLKTRNQTNCPIVNIKCNDKCYCEKGYARDSNKTCIPIDQCNVPQCGKNEIYNECPALSCKALNCSQLGYPVPCPFVPAHFGCPSGPGCICKDGYLRNKRGICVPEKQCPSCGGDPNAQPGCGMNCGRRCSNYNKGPVACAQVCKVNGCDCKKDYVYDDNIQQCVRPKQCTPVCKNNEVYSSCIQGQCRPQNCTQLGKPVACPRIDPKYCKKGCLCKEGYLRDESGICVPEKNCTSSCTNAHEIYDLCPPVCPPQTCEAIGKVYPCPLMPPGSAYCKPDCRCEDGFYRNKINECISKDNCLQCTGPHEFFSCGTACDNRCSNINTQNRTNCPIINIMCNNKCYCEDGYARDENEICIPVDQCKVPECGKNEEYVECPSSRCQPQNCSQLGYPIDCSDLPEPGSCTEEPACLCKDGYLRNKKGKCIPKKNCPSCGGDPNAVSGCGVNCNKHCADLKGKPRPCLKICRVNACDCKEGYYLDENIGECVLPKQCTEVCGKNEVYSSCIQGECRPLNCTQLGQSLPCPRIDPKYCKKGCLCKQGYLRSENGTCVPEKECPSPCLGSHEVYDPCPVPCPPQTCEALIRPPPCPAPPPDASYCRGSCQCEDGYYRNILNECITKDECLQCTGENEFFSCGTECDNRCSDINTQNRTNCPIVNIMCNKKCYCKDGYARDENEKCIPVDQCKAPQCGENEVLEECPATSCQPQYCYEVGYSITCPDLPDSYSCPRKPECICKDGYVRNKKDKCIPKDECPTCGGDPNAKPGCGVNCLKHCSDLIKPRGCPRICYPNACDCKDGFYYDDNAGKCVIREECTQQCGEHEYYEKCPDTLCQPQNCSEVGFPIPCPSVEPGSCPGKPACVCEFGYVKSKNGTCIPKNECPSCNGDPNARGGCGVNCNKHCYDLNKEPGACILLCYPNGCDCDEGYYFDDNIQACVLPEECTKTCGDNEVFSDCINGGCDMKNCSQLGQPTICFHPVKCKSGCLCKNGYLRAENGTCVPEDQCEPKCTKLNEVYDPCPSTCPPQTCESLNHRYFCPCMPANKTDEDCVGSCRCKPDYWRNSIGECISKKNCLKCTGPNEYYSCGVPCDNECATLYKQSQTNCPIKNKKCTEQCYCEEGYARNENDTCIPIDQCPEPECGKNERYEECPSCVRTPQYCSELGFPISCPKSNSDDDEPACVCIDGYVRNETDECIPVKQCPSCGGDPNAEAGCGINCNRQCADYKQEPGACIELCKPNACDCKEGFYFDANLGLCVRPEKCTPVCKNNEVYDTCVNGGCEMKNCSQLGGPTLCIDPIECEDGCLCKSGYLRNDENICVPEDECDRK